MFIQVLPYRRPARTATLGFVRDTGDIPTEMSLLTVDEAAHALGISTGAVRNRLSRGTLDSTKENGTVYVLLPSDMSRDTGDMPTDIPPESGALISAKDETIRVLEEQLKAEREQLIAEREASAELRRIIAGLVQRVPELEPAREPAPERRESDVSVSEERGSGDAPPEGQGREKRFSWWRKIFFG
jgi:hypothetical protein